MAILFVSFLGTLGAICPSSARAQCVSSQGPNSPASMTTIPLTGALFSWSNPIGAQLLDASDASAGISLGILSSANSNYLVAKGFGFSIPSVATICEIIVQVDRSATGLGIGGAVTDESVRLLKAGVLTGSDEANTSTA